jgi:hypothetical protein
MMTTRVDVRSPGEILLRSTGLGSAIGATVGGGIGLFEFSLPGLVFGVMLGGIPGCLLGLLNGAALVVVVEQTRSRTMARLAAAATTAVAIAAVAAVVRGLFTRGAVLAITGLALIAFVSAPRAAFESKRRRGPKIGGQPQIPPGTASDPRSPGRAAQVAGFGVVLGLGLGAVVGLVFGLVSYPPTAAFAAVEGGFLGLGPGAIVGLVGAALVRAGEGGRGVR